MEHGLGVVEAAVVRAIDAQPAHPAVGRGFPMDVVLHHERGAGRRVRRATPVWVEYRLGLAKMRRGIAVASKAPAHKQCRRLPVIGISPIGPRHSVQPTPFAKWIEHGLQHEQPANLEIEPDPAGSNDAAIDALVRAAGLMIAGRRTSHAAADGSRQLSFELRQIRRYGDTEPPAFVDELTREAGVRWVQWRAPR